MIQRIVAIAFASIVMTGYAEELELDDGRRIVLHENGTWTFLSSDRLLATSDGRQVRVREDGSWEYTGEIVPQPGASAGEVVAATLGEVTFTLKELAIETSRSSTHKSSRKKTNTVFLVGLHNRGKAEIQLNPDLIEIAIEDSSGREYPVLDISPETLTLEPQQRLDMQVRADGSPHWFTTRTMELYLKSESGEVRVLKGLLSEAKRRELELP